MHRLDRKLHRQRYLVEIFFHRLKRFRPSPLATRRLRATTWPSCNSAARGSGLADAELGARVARDTFEAGSARVAERTGRLRPVASEEGQGPATGLQTLARYRRMCCQSVA
jgi:hypothetical protein